MILGIDVGATKIAMAGFSFPGAYVDYKKFPSAAENDSGKAISEIIDEALKGYLALFPQASWQAVGVGVVGHADPDRGIWLRSSNISVAEPIDLQGLVRQRLDVPVYVDNDVNAATMAEMELGTGKRYRNFIYINLGTGIAAGLVCDGILIRGTSNFAGEIGQMVISADMKPADLICRRTVEDLASGAAIRRVLQQRRNAFRTDPASEDFSAAFLFRSAAEGDPEAVTLRESVLSALEAVAENLVNIFNPEALIFGGSMSKQPEVISRISAAVRARVPVVAAASLRSVEVSRLGAEYVGVIGAAQLAWNRLHAH